MTTHYFTAEDGLCLSTQINSYMKENNLKIYQVLAYTKTSFLKDKYEILIAFTEANRTLNE